MKIGLLIVGNLIQFLNMILNKYFIILTLLRVEASLQYHFGVRGSRPGEGQPERLYTLLSFINACHFKNNTSENYYSSSGLNSLNQP